MSVPRHIKLAAAAHLAERQFVLATEKWLILRDENLRLMLSVKEGQRFENKKGVLK